MRILLVAPQSPDTILGSIGGYCKNALESLSHELEVFDFRQSQFLNGSAGLLTKKYLKKLFPAPTKQIPFVGLLEKEKMNKLLPIAAEEYQPDILFVLMGDTIFPETLEKIKKSGITTVNWFHDSVLEPLRKDFVQKISPYYDYFFMIDSEDVLNYTKIDAGFVKTIPLACQPIVHKRIDLIEEEKEKYRSEVCFVGTIKYNRKQLLAQLSDFDLGIWGYWEDKVAELNKCLRGQHIFGEEAVRIYNASRIVLDIHLTYKSEYKQFNVTPRVFEVPASRALLLTNESPLLKDLYEIEEEIVSYKNEKELKDLIHYYLRHPAEREDIARKGQTKAYKEHTYEKRFEDMLSTIEQNG